MLSPGSKRLLIEITTETSDIGCPVLRSIDNMGALGKQNFLGTSIKNTCEL